MAYRGAHVPDRSATTASTREARRAGSHVASRATSQSHRNHCIRSRVHWADAKQQRGHDSGQRIKQLTAEQGTGPIADVTLLRGDFWPEEESIEDVLPKLHEWRGHVLTDPAA